MPYYRPFGSTVYIQRGKGLGGLFSSIARFAAPLFRRGVSTISKIGRSSLAKSIARDVKDTALQTGLQLASTAIKPGSSKEDVKQVLSSGLDHARTRVGKRIDSHIAHGNNPPKKRRRKKGPREEARKDIFE